MALENVILTTDNCRYCLMCRHVCPGGHVTRLETLTPHGWGLTIASVRRGLLDWNASTVDKLYSCADCGTCRAHCVTDQPLPEAIAAARAEVVALNRAPAAAYQVDQALRRWGNPYQEMEPQPVDGLGDIALFVGDEAAYLWPAGLEAALKLLEAAEVAPVLIGAGRNNGYLASSLGFPDTARELAYANLADLKASDAHKLLVLTPGDAFAFRQLYAERLGVEWPRQVVVEELTTFLDEKLQEDAFSLGRSDDQTPWCYVDPAHSVRVPERHEAPRRLLAAVRDEPARELFWRRERAHPTGSTALKFTNPQLADHLTYARLGDARQVGVQLLISEDPGTLSALSTHSQRFGLQVKGFYEILAEQLK